MMGDGRPAHPIFQHSIVPSFRSFPGRSVRGHAQPTEPEAAPRGNRGPKREKIAFGKRFPTRDFALGGPTRPCGCPEIGQAQGPAPTTSFILMDRRTFLRWMAGAGASGTGLGFMHHMGPAQTQDPTERVADPSRIEQKLPDRWISPVQEEPYLRPGLWTIFATTCRECPAGCGMHVRVREGRAIKCEGNPDHPVNQGGLCPRGQSAPQGLYDPDRVRGPLRRRGNRDPKRDEIAFGKGSQVRNIALGDPNPTPWLPRPGQAQGGDPNRERMRLGTRPAPTSRPQAQDNKQHRMEGPGLGTPNPVLPPPPPSGFEARPWTAALSEIADALQNAKRLFLVSDLQTGTLAEIMQQFHTTLGLPGAVAFYEAFDYEPLRAANERLFGRAVLPRYRLAECDFILSFGAEFLETWISNVEFAWQFAQMHHRGPDYRGEMVYIGPKLSMTAANADHFLQIPAGQEYSRGVGDSAGGGTTAGHPDCRFRISDFGFGRRCRTLIRNPRSAIRNSRKSPAALRMPRMPWRWAGRSVPPVRRPRISRRSSCS